MANDEVAHVLNLLPAILPSCLCSSWKAAIGCNMDSVSAAFACNLGKGLSVTIGSFNANKSLHPCWALSSALAMHEAFI